MSAALNLDESYVEYLGDELERDVAAFETEKRNKLQRLDDIQEEFDGVLDIVSPAYRSVLLQYSIPNEPPSSLVARTVGNKNPGLSLIERLSSEITRYKLLSKDETPIIAGEEPTDAEHLENLV
jgi:hypothetical protein